MKFTIYHHNDFDGIAGASIFAKFLSLKDNLPFSQFEFIAVDYDIKNDWISKNLNHPCAIIDFLYHPGSDWWFDHHESTFLNNAFYLKSYKHSLKKHWDTKFLSCPSLILAHFEKYYKKYAILFKKEYKELINWSDKIDGATYSSPEEIYGSGNPFININKTLAINRTQKYFQLIIAALFENNLDLILKSKIYNTTFRKSEIKERKAVNMIRKIIQVDGAIAYFDQSKFDLPFQRYLAYYLFPGILYRVAVYKKEDKYSVSVNYNNWSAKKNKNKPGGAL